jgi:hypothetical protein
LFQIGNKRMRRSALLQNDAMQQYSQATRARTQKSTAHGSFDPYGYLADDMSAISAGTVMSAAAGDGTAGSIPFAGGQTGFSPQGSNQSRYNWTYDDLSRGTIVESWIPINPRRQVLMFRQIYLRQPFSGRVVDIRANTMFGGFDFTGIRDKKILETYEAAADAINLPQFLPFMSIERDVTGRCVAQLLLDPSSGIYSDILIHDAGYVLVYPAMRTGFQPAIDIVPDERMRRWAQSTDPRIIRQREGIDPGFIAQIVKGGLIPLDPDVTAYLPRRTSWGDVQGTSLFVRDLNIFAMEKSLIDATVTGTRRRAGPIYQVAVGADNFQPVQSQIDDVTTALMAAEEDNVTSYVGTDNMVAITQIRGGLNENMWRWTEEFDAFSKYRTVEYGISEALMVGDLSIDMKNAPPLFVDNLRADRAIFEQDFIINKFCKVLAEVHNFRKRSTAELSHRIRVSNDNSQYELPQVTWHRPLETAPDDNRVAQLDKMKEVGLPVTLKDYNLALGGGDYDARLRSYAEDARVRLETARLHALHKKIDAIYETPPENLVSEIEALAKELGTIRVARDDTPYDVAELSKKGKERAEEATQLSDDTDPEDEKYLLSE